MAQATPIEEKALDKANVSVNATVPAALIEKIEQVRKARFDNKRADTIRFLILRALADLGFLSDSEKTALGLHTVTPQREAT